MTETPAAPATPPHQPSLLFVDDDTLVRELMVEGLRHQGYHVAQAEDGPTALAWLASGHQLDLMITDYSMPEMTGLDLISHVRSTRPALPIFLLTGFADEHVARKFAAITENQGVLLHKPIRIKDLAARVAAKLAEAGSG
jgi:CheY-like chemotaxis protein